MQQPHFERQGTAAEGAAVPAAPACAQSAAASRRPYAPIGGGWERVRALRSPQGPHRRPLLRKRGRHRHWHPLLLETGPAQKAAPYRWTRGRPEVRSWWAARLGVGTRRGRWLQGCPRAPSVGRTLAGGRLLPGGWQGGLQWRGLHPACRSHRERSAAPQGGPQRLPLQAEALGQSRAGAGPLTLMPGAPPLRQAHLGPQVQRPGATPPQGQRQGAPLTPPQGQRAPRGQGWWRGTRREWAWAGRTRLAAWHRPRSLLPKRHQLAPLQRRGPGEPGRLLLLLLQCF